MSLLTLMLFLPACFALNMVPGPNNLLAMNNAQRYGFKCAMWAGLGRVMAFVIMIFIAASGLAVLLFASETLFLTVKVIGALYLFWIAIQLWQADIKTEDSLVNNKLDVTPAQLAKQEFLLAIGNPKAILIFTAFFPQFITSSGNIELQFFLLGAFFLLLEVIAIALYVCFGLYLRQWFSKPHMRKLFNRGCATFIGALGFGLFIEQKNT